MSTSTTTTWRETTLEDIAYINPQTPLNKDGLITHISMDDIDSFTRKIHRSSKKKFGGGSRFKNGDTLIARITPSLENGKTAYVDCLGKDEVGFGSTEFIVVREKQETSDSKFLFYFATSPSFRNIAIKSMTGTSGRQRVQTDVVATKPFLFPQLPEQRAIAAVLSSLDDKIELLREQNKTLEATAQAIFKEWFVNFNFPGATGRMIDSELGEIPEGWKVGKLTELFDFIKGIEPGSDNYSAEKLSNEYLPFYRVQDTSNYNEKPNVFVEKKLLNGKIFEADDILISLDGTIGRVFIAGPGGYSSGIRKVVGKAGFISKSLIFCFLKSDKFQGELNSFAGSETTIKHAGGAIEHIRLIFEKSVCEKYGRMACPIYQKLISNISQIQTLSALRDALLPKLMKGAVRIKGFDNYEQNI